MLHAKQESDRIGIEALETGGRKFSKFMGHYFKCGRDAVPDECDLGAPSLRQNLFKRGSIVSIAGNQNKRAGAGLLIDRRDDLRNEISIILLGTIVGS
jgi:hypothetical protein